ncbi:MAG: hypothetical protein ABFR75_09170 [Acidobacteriota bacterium]
MAEIKCKYEEEVLRSLSNNKLTPEMNEHIYSCRYCKDLVEVTSWMGEFKNAVSLSEDQDRNSLPDAEDMWSRAFQPERAGREIVEKVMHPLRIAQILSNLVISAGIIIIILWKFGDISGFIKNYFKPDYFDVHFFSYVLRFFRSSYFISIPVILILISMFSYLLYSFLKQLQKQYAENSY